MAVVRTLAEPSRHELPKIKGSRFIASLAPAATARDAMAFVEARREEFRDATHNCFAWRVASDEHGTGEAFRYHDDGEPSGTAGRPILREIDGRGLVRVVAVVTRYYGGTKLGACGLARAYGGAVAAALDEAQIVETRVTKALTLRYAYELSGAVQGVLHAWGLEPGTAEYAADVRVEVAVPVEEAERLAAALREATAGRVEVS